MIETTAPQHGYSWPVRIEAPASTIPWNELDATDLETFYQSDPTMQDLILKYRPDFVKSHHPEKLGQLDQ